MRTRKVTDLESLADFADGLKTLRELAGVYDSGHTSIILLMAVEVHKLLTEHPSSMKLRGTIYFNGPRDYFDNSILNVVNKLIVARIDAGLVTCIPFFYKRGHEPLDPMAFREWCSRDSIYIASAAVEGSPPGFVPVNGSPAVAFEKRERLTRRKLVELIRNKRGAHYDHEIPVLMDELEDYKYLYSVRVESGGRTLNTDDGSLPVFVGPLRPMMRQVVHELLCAYGIDDASSNNELGSNADSIYVGQPVIARNPPPYNNQQ